MPVDAELLAAARAAEAHLVDAERAADIARAEFRHAVRRMHLAGGSLREIADALDLSHQRIHQIVEEAGGARRWRGGTRRGGDMRGDLFTCSFCGKAQRQVKKLIAGPHGFICAECVATVGQVITTGEAAVTPLSAIKPVGAEAPTLKCGFCGKRRHQVRGLAVAAGGAICTECLSLCGEIIDEDLA